MNRISNYEELVAERKFTEMVISNRKQAIHDRIEDIKEQAAPLLGLLSLLKIVKSTTKSGNNSALKLGTSLAIDIAGQQFLGKTNWITRLFLPPVLKTFSSGVIELIRKARQKE